MSKRKTEVPPRSAKVLRSDLNENRSEVGKDAEAEQIEKQLATSALLVAEFSCPITHELILNPVTTVEGQLYERSAIEKWFKTNSRSPMTNVEIDKKLFEARSVSSAIRVLVTNGQIVAQHAGEWKSKIANEERIAKLERDASNFDPDALYDLGLTLFHGTHGAKINKRRAVVLWQRGHVRHDVRCSARFGKALIEGFGCKQNIPFGIFVVTSVAHKSCFAANVLGNLFSNGQRGFTSSNKVSRHLACTLKHGARIMNATTCFSRVDNNRRSQENGSKGL